jgi:dihydrofolate synthase/folylpolyglutamate synthase
LNNKSDQNFSKEDEKAIISDLLSRRPENQIDFSLNRLYALLERLGNPQNSCRTIHLAGTNGKTSTTFYIEHLLNSLGYQTGSFTSPHLVTFYERIKINCQNISSELFFEVYQQIIQEVDQYQNEHPDQGEFGFFEILTIIAFEVFKQMKLDFVIIETGLGGRLDATNVVENVALAIITSIGLDHTDILGDTLELIAQEKAGIIKQNVPTLLLEPKDIDDLVRATFVQKSGQKNSDLIRYFPNQADSYLQTNFAMAVKAVEVVLQTKLSDNLKQQVFKSANPPGRFEVLPKTNSQQPQFILDTAHNLDAAKTLVQTLKSYFEGSFLNASENLTTKTKPPIVAVVAMFEDKDYAGFLQELSKVVDVLILTQNSSPRSVSADLLYKNAIEIYEDAKTTARRDVEVLKAADIPNALQIVEISYHNALVLVTGSNATVGDFLTVIPPSPRTA